MPRPERSRLGLGVPPTPWRALPTWGPPRQPTSPNAKPSCGRSWTPTGRRRTTSSNAHSAGVRRRRILKRPPLGGRNDPRGYSRMVLPDQRYSPGTSYRFPHLGQQQSGRRRGRRMLQAFADTAVAADCVHRRASQPTTPRPCRSCRAYELVTPADTNGRPSKGMRFAGDHRFSTVESSPSRQCRRLRDRRRLPAGHRRERRPRTGDLYRSTRGAGGWDMVQPFGPSGTETNNPSPGSTSPDQEHAFFSGRRRRLCRGQRPGKSLRPGPGRASRAGGAGKPGYRPLRRGKTIAAGGTHIVFQTGTARPAAVRARRSARRHRSGL